MSARLLFIAEAVTLAHVGRALALARIAHDAGFDVTLACDPRYGGFLRDLPFEAREIASIAPEAFMRALARGSPLYSSDTLERYAGDDLALIDRVRPDAVVGDFRLSLSVSARVAGVRYVNVTNAYWSPWARPDFHVPSIPLARRAPLPVAQALFSLARPLAFAVHAMPMNRVRRRHGLAPLRADVRHVYCDGDLTLYADVPDLVPLAGAPPTHRFIGPVLWSPPVVPPPWWHEVLAGDAPIYVTLGSSGAAERLPAVVDALRSLGRPLVVATAGRSADVREDRQVRVADYVPGDAIAARACVVVCNGGSPTAYQALVHGVPVVGLPGNLDQFLNMSAVARAGAGVMLRADRLDEEALRAAVARALAEPGMREAAARIARQAAALPAGVAFTAALDAGTPMHIPRDSPTRAAGADPAR